MDNINCEASDLVMTLYAENVATVLGTMRKYYYSETSMSRAHRCFDALEATLGNNADDNFSIQGARKWCESSVPRTLQPMYKIFIDRLEDVYVYGKVLGTHLKINLHISEKYASIIEEYVNNIRHQHTTGTLNVIRGVCIRFCLFLQHKNITEIENINYAVLEQYIQYLDDSFITSRIGIVSEFLLYLSHYFNCKIGYYWFMHFKQKSKVVSIKDLSEDARKAIENIREESLIFPTEQIYNEIPYFSEDMKKARYNDRTIRAICAHLLRFALFLDMSNLGYDFRILELLIKDQGSNLYGSNINQARRALYMFEDYTQEGGILPEHRLISQSSSFMQLPMWCLDGMSIYLTDKKKEGLCDESIYTIRGLVVRFCKFIVISELVSFEELTPLIIKRFNHQDQHKTLAAKNRCNAIIRDFLYHLEIKGMIKSGIHLALSKCYSGSSCIVKTLDDNNRRLIEMYCDNATTPIQIRDAAIILIGYTTGMRPSDIVGLKKKDISLSEMIISFIQRKTKKSQIVNLDVKTANAIIRYIREVRPKGTGDDHIFLSIHAPYVPLHSGICNKSLRRSGVTGVCFYTLRKTFASDRVKSGVKISDVACDLGHTSQSSVQFYVALDMDRMRQCSQTLAETKLILNDGRYTNV